MSELFFDEQAFLDDLATLVGFRTVVCSNRDEFARASSWIRDFFDPTSTEFIDFDCHGLTTTIVKPTGSTRPGMIGDGHIEVVPGSDDLYVLSRDGDRLYGRGVADMKTQVLAMMYTLRRMIAEGDHRDFWLVLSQDEEVGSEAGVAVVVDYLVAEDLLPPVVFAPDGGPDFAYVEKEKGIARFTVTAPGIAAHASRPFLGASAIERMQLFNSALTGRFPGPFEEGDWVLSVAMTSIHAGTAPNRIPHECTAGFDCRFPETFTSERIKEVIAGIAAGSGVDIQFDRIDSPAYYPSDAPIAREYLRILRDVSGREPQIIHSSGASNGRLYVAAGDVHVLMSNPATVGAHADDECVLVSSLAAYCELVYRTARLV